MKDIISVVSLIFLPKTLICGQVPVSNLLKLADLVVNELMKRMYKEIF